MVMIQAFLSSNKPDLLMISVLNPVIYVTNFALFIILKQWLTIYEAAQDVFCDFVELTITITLIKSKAPGCGHMFLRLKWNVIIIQKSFTFILSRLV